MHDGRGRLGLAGEPLLRQRALRQMRRQHLDRHAALQLAIEPLQHDAHAAVADDLQHVVAAQSAEHVRLVGGLQMLDGEIDLRPFVASRHGRIQFVLGQQRRGFLAPCRRRRPFAPARRCMPRTLPDGGATRLRRPPAEFPAKRRFQKCDRTVASFMCAFSNSVDGARSRASTRHLATRTAPTVMPSFLAASAGEVPTTPVSQNACQVAGWTSPRTCSAAR